MDRPQVLLVEDDPDLREAISVTLSLGGVPFQAFECAEDALPLIGHDDDQLLVTDFRLPGMNGLELLDAARKRHAQLPVVVMTAYADTQLAIQALKSGARDFLVKPFMPQQLLEVISRHLPRPAQATNAAAAAIIAADAATAAVMQRCERVAPTDTTVLLTGESGAGKDVFARHIHGQSKRQGKPYVAINCAAIPEQLLESELFGHEKGAFTGAVSQRAGRFEQCDGGSLFLDEIGDMPIQLQSKILRVLQDGEFTRVGGNQVIRSDVRIIAATNKNLEQEVSERRFREDLFYRLNVVRIQLPPFASARRTSGS